MKKLEPVPDEFGYHYPRTCFVEMVTIKGQIEKMESELFELHQLAGRKGFSMEKFCGELEDLIVATETLRRHIQEKHGAYVNTARRKTHNKLRKRGHFTL